MATRPQFDDSERNPQKIDSRDNLPVSDGPFSEEELDALLDVILLLDEWDRKRKIL
jgi:hypothetical protein